MFLVLAGMPSVQQMIIIAVVVVLLFGAKKLPELARGVGKSMGEFRKAREEFDKELAEATKTPSTPPTPEQIVSRDEYKSPSDEPAVDVTEKTEDKA